MSKGDAIWETTTELQEKLGHLNLETRFLKNGGVLLSCDDHTESQQGTKSILITITKGKTSRCCGTSQQAVVT